MNSQLITDIVFLVGLLLLILLTGVISEKVLTIKNIHNQIPRKIFHIVGTSAAAFSILLVNKYGLLLTVGFIAVIFTYFAVSRNLFKLNYQHNRKRWGVFFLPLSYVFLLLFFKDEKWVVFSSLLILAFGDSLAAITGSIFGRKRYDLTGDEKSYLGSTAFFVAALIVLVVTGSIKISKFPGLEINSYFLLSGVIIAFLLTLFEGIASKGTDNLFVPIAASLLIYIFITSPDAGILFNFVLGLLLAAAVGFISYRVKFLTNDGAIATFLLAGFIFGLGGLKWSVPILTFFILSSLLSKFRKNKNREVDIYFEKTGVRDSMQVFVNGGIGGILVVINQINPALNLYLIYIASLAAVCADTWATEIGTMYKATTYNIINFRPVTQGISGGISVPGTFGALLGAAVIALSGLFWINFNIFQYLIIIILAGFLGSFFDSILGATIQAQYECSECTNTTEKLECCGTETHHVKGFLWLNNDLVNLFASIFGGVIVIVISSTFL